MLKTILVNYNAFQSNQVFEFPVALGEDTMRTREEDLETIFRQCNVVDGSEWIVGESAKRIKTNQKGLRSMSVGDTVTFFFDSGGWSVYLCAGMGWEMIGSA